MDIYLPIAGQSVNALLIVVLGFVVGILSGMFGVGGGFLTTPLLIFYGIPPTVAVASATTQITGASVSGAMVHMRRGGVDLKMGGVMIVGGFLGSFVGAGLFRFLQSTGQIDVVIGLLYVLILFGIGGLMLIDSLKSLGYLTVTDSDKPRPRHNRWVASLPYRWRFHVSGLYISPIAPLALGFLAGILTVFLGIGGGFILVPAMIYLLGMPARVVIGTSLLMILAVSAATTMVHSLTTRAVDIVLAGLLLVGGVIGAQYGAILTTRLKPDYLRLALAVIILLVGLRMFLGLFWHPDISARQVQIRYSFNGAQLLLFGAVVYPGGRPPDRQVDIAVVLRGPVQPILVREKEKIAGIWMNADSNRFRSAPSYYAVASSRPISDLVDERTAAIYELGLHNLQLSPGGGALPEKERRFEAGLLDLRSRQGLYSENPHGVEINGGVLYRAVITIPSQVPVGTYTAETFLIDRHKVIAAATRDIEINKSGFERTIAIAARRHRLLYGLSCVFLSLGLGWAAAAAFRRRF